MDITSRYVPIEVSPEVFREADEHCEREGEALLREPRDKDNKILVLGYSAGSEMPVLLDPEVLVEDPAERPHRFAAFEYTVESIYEAAESAEGIASAHLPGTAFFCEGELIGEFGDGFSGVLGDWTTELSVQSDRTFTLIQWALDEAGSGIRLEASELALQHEMISELLRKHRERARYKCPPAGKWGGPALAFHNAFQRALLDYLQKTGELPYEPMTVNGTEVTFVRDR